MTSQRKAYMDPILLHFYVMQYFIEFCLKAVCTKTGCLLCLHYVSPADWLHKLMLIHALTGSGHRAPSIPATRPHVPG